MALDRFRAAPLPNPPSQWDPQYMRQVIRVLENYFSQLDSRTPNNAEKYSADEFVGGSFSGTDITASSVDTNSLEANGAQINQLGAGAIDAVYVDTDAFHSHIGEITTLTVSYTHLTLPTTSRV